MMNTQHESNIFLVRFRKIIILFFVIICLFLIEFLAPQKVVQSQAGVTPIACNPSYGSGGLAPGTYDTTVAGQPAVIIVSENYNAATPTFLTFYLHGDGGNYGAYSGQGGALNQFVQGNGWIYVALQSYTDTDSGVTRWWADGVSSNDNSGIEANAQLLENAFEEMFSNYNICRNILLGHSASGGSWFYDAYFVPTCGGAYPAFMNLNCGSSGIDSGWTGFPFYSNLLVINQDADVLNRTQLHYTVGTTDFLYDEVQDAAPHYDSLGFDVTTDYLDGVGHCAFDISQKTIAYWTMIRDSTVVITVPLSNHTYLPLIIASD